MTIQENLFDLIFSTAAEWLLKNGACARFVNSPILFCDYNTLPPENVKFVLKEIEATNAGINAAGFAHLKGCEQLDRIVLKDCSYITDEALERLDCRKDSLKILEITKCDISSSGLRSLKVLTNLEKLTVRDIKYLDKPEEISLELKQHLKNCEIDIKHTKQ